MAQQAPPILTSRFICPVVSGCLNFEEEATDFDVSLASSIEKGFDGLVYKYEFTNHSPREVKLLLLLSHKDRVLFVAEFITGTDKTIFIVLKPQEVKTFAVKDNSSVMQVRMEAAFVDKHGLAYAGHMAMIYFPAWKHIFGQ